MRIRREKAFGLVQLLVVIAIAVVLTALLLPALRSTREKASGARCINNLRIIYPGWLAYAEENNGMAVPSYLNGSDWSATLETSTLLNPRRPPNRGNVTFYQCPNNPSRLGSFVWGSNYAYSPNMGNITNDPKNWPDPATHIYAPKKLASMSKPTQTLLLTDAAVDENRAQTAPNVPLYCMTTFSQGWVTSGQERDRQVGFRWHQGLANCLFLDGHVEPMTAKQMDERYYAKTLFIEPYQ